MTPTPEQQALIQAEHMEGAHYGIVHPNCDICWDEDDEPEAPDPWGTDQPFSAGGES